MPTLNILYKREIAVNDKISIYIPSVGEVIDNEDEYYGMISLITAMPIDMMVQLDDSGIDFTSINAYQLFLLLFPVLKEMNTSLVFSNIDLSKFELAINEETQNIVLLDSENDIVIDRNIHAMIANTLRSLHNIKKNNKRPGNEDARKYLLERARTKMSRKKRTERSGLEYLIISMVNTEQFKYDFSSTLDLSIYQFNESVRQIINKIEYNNRMYGVYTGSIDVKKLPQDQLSWIAKQS